MLPMPWITPRLTIAPEAVEVSKPVPLIVIPAPIVSVPFVDNAGRMYAPVPIWIMPVPLMLWLPLKNVVWYVLTVAFSSDRSFFTTSAV